MFWEEIDVVGADVMGWLVVYSGVGGGDIVDVGISMRGDEVGDGWLVMGGEGWV